MALVMPFTPKAEVTLWGLPFIQASVDLELREFSRPSKIDSCIHEKPQEFSGLLSA